MQVKHLRKLLEGCHPDAIVVLANKKGRRRLAKGLKSAGPAGPTARDVYYGGDHPALMDQFKQARRNPGGCHDAPECVTLFPISETDSREEVLAWYGSDDDKDPKNAVEDTQDVASSTPEEKKEDKEEFAVYAELVDGFWVPTCQALRCVVQEDEQFTRFLDSLLLPRRVQPGEWVVRYPQAAFIYGETAFRAKYRMWFFAPPYKGIPRGTQVQREAACLERGLHMGPSLVPAWKHARFIHSATTTSVLVPVREEGTHTWRLFLGRSHYDAPTWFWMRLEDTCRKKGVCAYIQRESGLPVNAIQWDGQLGSGMSDARAQQFVEFVGASSTEWSRVNPAGLRLSVTASDRYPKIYELVVPEHYWLVWMHGCWLVQAPEVFEREYVAVEGLLRNDS